MKTVTNNFIDQSLNEFKDCLKSAFEINQSVSSKSKGGPGKVTLSSSQGFRNKLWSELEKAFSEDIYQICKQVKFLQTTLNSITNVDLNVAHQFWTRLGEIMQEEIKSSTAAIQQALEEDYPKLLKGYYEMTKKLKYEPFNFK